MYNNIGAKIKRFAIATCIAESIALFIFGIFRDILISFILKYVSAAIRKSM